MVIFSVSIAISITAQSVTLVSSSLTHKTRSVARMRRPFYISSTTRRASAINVWTSGNRGPEPATPAALCGLLTFSVRERKKPPNAGA